MSENHDGPIYSMLSGKDGSYTVSGFDNDNNINGTYTVDANFNSPDPSVPTYKNVTGPTESPYPAYIMYAPWENSWWIVTGGGGTTVARKNNTTSPPSVPLGSWTSDSFGDPFTVS